MTIEFYSFRERADVRKQVAAILARTRRSEALSQPEFALFCLWLLGGFKRSALAIGVWREKNWPIVRRADGTWVALEPALGKVHEMTVDCNYTGGYAYRQLS